MNITKDLETIIRFAMNTSVRGAQISLLPGVLNESTCKNQFRENVPKSDGSDILRKQIEPRLGGNYSLNAFVLERNGSPDPGAVPANPPLQVTAEGTGTSNKPQGNSPISSIDHLNAREIIITYTSPAPNSSTSEYIGILIEDTSSSSYTLLRLPFAQTSIQVTVNESRAYCLSVYYLYSDGSISSAPIANEYIFDGEYTI